MSIDSAVQAFALKKNYDSTPVVNGLSFSIPRGQFCAFLGPNGAGKTTTLRMLTGICPASEGSLTVLGYEIPRHSRRMREFLGIVPQQDSLDLDFTVTENLQIYGGYFGIGRRELKVRIRELLDFAALTDKADSRIYQLSGGMRRRLSIARALINRPRLLILDEPTTGLDPQSRQEIWRQLRTLQKEGLTLVMTTHYMDEAERLCDRIILMDHGRILADQSPESLIREGIESQVLEVFGKNARNWLATESIPDTVRHEDMGDSLCFYGDNLTGLLSSLENWSDIRYSYRPANLEDVFLKMTGRELRDG